jgi:hypothetical protein
MPPKHQHCPDSFCSVMKLNYKSSLADCGKGHLRTGLKVCTVRDKQGGKPNLPGTTRHYPAHVALTPHATPNHEGFLATVRSKGNLGFLCTPDEMQFHSVVGAANM